VSVESCRSRANELADVILRRGESAVTRVEDEPSSRNVCG
jgi:hypothetical protein